MDPKKRKFIDTWKNICRGEIKIGLNLLFSAIWKKKKSNSAAFHFEKVFLRTVLKVFFFEQQIF